ncbi:MAG: MmgE/PrpD family protein [Desulfobacterales bacterium]|jgi:2-methylcitrate dehydratase PrpD
MGAKDITARLANFIESTEISDIPDHVIQTAKLLVSDFFGVATAGSVEPSAKIIQEVISEQGHNGKASVIGTDMRSHPTWSSLANGISGHTVDYDDVSQPMYGHPTTAVLPAALALGELLEISGSELLKSYIIGLEIAVKLSYAMNPAHYQHGWHSTCTLGSIGATAAAAKLLGLNGHQLRAALALGASQAGGLQQNFGTMIKPFHAGRAAQNGVLAAILAKKGWTGDQNILESPLGFFHVFCGEGRYDGPKSVDILGSPFDIEQPGIILKKFPSCAFSHPVIDAALEIAQDPQYEPAATERVEGHIHALADQILIHRNPQTGLGAKFSLEACIALALVDGKVSTKSFTDDKVSSNAVQQMMARVRRKIAPGAQTGPEAFGPATITVFLKDGRKLEARVEKARGNPENPMSPQEVQDKYLDCCSGVLTQHSIVKSLSLLADLDKLKSIGELMDCYRVP